VPLKKPGPEGPEGRYEVLYLSGNRLFADGRVVGKTRRENSIGRVELRKQLHRGGPVQLPVRNVLKATSYSIGSPCHGNGGCYPGKSGPRLYREHSRSELYPGPPRPRTTSKAMPTKDLGRSKGKKKRRGNETRCERRCIGEKKRVCRNSSAKGP